MPLKGFICPIERDKVPFDHFESCTAWVGGRPAFNPWLAKFIADGAMGDVRHAGIDLTTTRCSSCPRSNFIQAFFDFWLDPQKAAVRARGTALHIIAGEYSDPELWHSEEHDGVLMTCYGTLFPQLVEELGVDGKYVTEKGVVCSGKLDAVKKDMTELVNFKFPQDWSVRWRDKGGKAKPDHWIQMNIDRLLLSQQDWAMAAGMDPDSILLTIQDHACGANASPQPMSCEIRDEEWMLQQKPGGGQYTVQEIVTLAVMMQRARDKVKGDPVKMRQLAASIPCAGETQFNAKGCMMYCDVNGESAKLMREFGRPEEMEERGENLLYNLGLAVEITNEGRDALNEKPLTPGRTFDGVE